MNLARRTILISMPLLAVTWGCGQKGALYWPEAEQLNRPKTTSASEAQTDDNTDASESEFSGAKQAKSESAPTL